MPLAHDALLEAAAAQVQAKTEAGEVDNAVVAQLVEQKIARRTELLAGAVDAQKGYVKKLGKIKPNPKGFTEDGTEIAGDCYTKAQVEAIKDLKKKIADLDAVVAARDFDKMSAMGF